MSENHIYSELMVHLEVWFDLKNINIKKLKGIKAQAEEANLNVDESRPEVRFLMFLFDYTGKEEFYG